VNVEAVVGTGQISSLTVPTTLPGQCLLALESRLLVTLVARVQVTAHAILYGRMDLRMTQDETKTHDVAPNGLLALIHLIMVRLKIIGTLEFLAQHHMYDTAVALHTVQSRWRCK